MTTIITRVFPDAAEAERAVSRLTLRGLPKRDRHIITHSGDVKTALKQAQVHKSAVAPYASLIAKGHAVLVVHANFTPLGVARVAREALAKFDTIDAGASVVEEHKTAWQPDHAPSVMKDHPLFLTLPDMPMPGRISSSFGIPLTKPHKDKNSLSKSGKPASRFFWPMPLLTKKSRSSSVFSGGRHMSKLFWPQRLVSTGQRSKSVIPGGGTPFSNRIGAKLIS
jgi:hypothetical protein